MPVDNNKIALYSIAGSILIAIATIIGNIIVTIISKRNEYKQAQFKTIMECAWNEYEYKTELVRQLAAKNGTTSTIYPFIEYVIFYAMFLKVLEKRKVKERHVEKALKSNREVIEYFYKYQKKYNERTQV